MYHLSSNWERFSTSIIEVTVDGLVCSFICHLILRYRGQFVYVFVFSFDKVTKDSNI